MPRTVEITYRVASLCLSDDLVPCNLVQTPSWIINMQQALNPGHQSKALRSIRHPVCIIKGSFPFSNRNPVSTYNTNGSSCKSFCPDRKFSGFIKYTDSDPCPSPDPGAAGQHNPCQW